MDNRPIGIFDSGFGGLTALSVVRKLLPNESIIYFADTGRVPYGAKTVEQLQIIAAQDLEFLASKGVKAILAACGTVSSTVPDILDSFKVPVTDVLRPAVRQINTIPGNAPVGVIATAASIRSGAYRKALLQSRPERPVIDIACPDFVPLIESGHVSPDDPAVQEAVERYLAPMKETGIAALILGCTHYGLVSEAIAAYLGREVQQISASGCAAAELCAALQEKDQLGSEGSRQYYTSGKAEDFASMAPRFLGNQLGGEVSAFAPWRIEK